jgi:ATP-dependent Clp protease ATP-binding subunit ClpA
LPLYDFRFTALIQALENETYLAEALFFPEIVRFGDDPKRLLDALRINSSNIIEKSPLLNLHMRRTSEAPAIEEVTLLLDPPPRSIAWRERLKLSFNAICWNHGEDAAIAYIPALGIEVAAKNRSELEKLLPARINAHLLRIKAASSLERLAWLQRGRMIILDESSFTALIRTPRQISADSEDEPKRSALEEVATVLLPQSSAEAYEIEDVVARLAETISGPNPRSVLIVGPSGVGKSTAVHELVRKRRSFQLGNTPFWATSGSRLVAGMSGFGMCQERCGRMWREARRLKAVLHLGNLVELMEVGKSIGNSQGIAGFFRPHLARGDFIAIVECTPEQLPLIEREDPHLLSVLHQITITEPSVEAGKKILTKYVASQPRGESLVEAECIDTLDRLHRRYATYSAYPGRPLRFLKNLLQDRDSDQTLSSEDVIGAFSRETGLPLFMLSDAVKLDLDSARDWFCKRVIGQPDVVDLVLDLLAIAKAGLARPRKPISSLLFIGPTGVGKTEMAKSLAEYLFHDRERMVRFDMSEYADPYAIGRLVGGIFGSEGLLTAKVRERPFGVILFDEFEKAHRLFFDLLLQVLGDGRLTDAAGRVADFSNAVVIMTSNLGAESFQRRSVGFSNDPHRAAKAREHFTREVKAFVRPELFNRIDRLVPFAPLDEQSVLAIARRELEELALRDGLRFRQVTMSLAEDVAGYLAQKGYDARYGARPLRRAIERELLVPLAEGLNNCGTEHALVADVRVEKRRLAVTVRPRVNEVGRAISAGAHDASLYELATRCRTLRSDTQRLDRSPAAMELRNEVFRLERLEKRLSTRRWKSAEDTSGLERLPALKRIMEQVKSASETIYDLEDRLRLALYGKAEFDNPALRNELECASTEWRDLLLSVCSIRSRRPDLVTLGVFSENAGFLFELAGVYYRLALESGAEVSIFRFQSDQGDESRKADEGKLLLLGRTVIKQKVDKPEPFFASPAGTVVGIAIGIAARFARLRYGFEQGLHTFVDKQKRDKCLVDTSEQQLDKYEPPVGLERRGSIAHQERRRLYNYDEFVVEDGSLKTKLHFQGRAIQAVVAWACEERMMLEAKSILDAE